MILLTSRFLGWSRGLVWYEAELLRNLMYSGFTRVNFSGIGAFWCFDFVFYLFRPGISVFCVYGVWVLVTVVWMIWLPDRGVWGRCKTEILLKSLLGVEFSCYGGFF